MGQDHQCQAESQSAGPLLLYPLHLSRVTQSMESPRSADLHQVDRNQALVQRHRREEHHPLARLQAFLGQVQHQQVLRSLSSHPVRLEHLQSARVLLLLELWLVNQDLKRQRLERLQVNRSLKEQRLEQLPVNQDPRPPLLALKLLRRELKQVLQQQQQVYLEPQRLLLEPSTRQVLQHLLAVLASLQLSLSTPKEALRPLLQYSQSLLRAPQLLHKLTGQRDLKASHLLVLTPPLHGSSLRVSSLLHRRHRQLPILRARQQQAFLLSYHTLLRPRAELHSNHPTLL